MSKIFGIGLSRTGTTSLTEALKILGYTAKHYPEPTDFDLYDALTDIPVAAAFEELDQKYSNSKFILTIRDDLKSWGESANLVMKRPTSEKAYAIREASFGLRMSAPDTDWPTIHEKHINRVRNYFQSRVQDLLVLPLEYHDKWQPLCHFLNKPVPNQPYPWWNRRKTLKIFQ